LDTRSIPSSAVPAQTSACETSGGPGIAIQRVGRYMPSERRSFDAKPTFRAKSSPTPEVLEQQQPAEKRTNRLLLTVSFESPQPTDRSSARETVRNPCRRTAIDAIDDLPTFVGAFCSRITSGSGRLRSLMLPDCCKFQPSSARASDQAGNKSGLPEGE
jgi:hypothetical protein